MDGLQMFISYGLKPHQLGFCGPKESEVNVLLNYLQGNSIEQEHVRQILSQFERAHAYCDLIAKSNGMSDPFSREVVEAYWLGSDLLEKVSAPDLRSAAAQDLALSGLSQKAVDKAVEKIPKKAVAHHSFSVLSKSGRNIGMNSLCLVGWGIVREKNADKIIVSSSSLSSRRGLKFTRDEVKVIAWDRRIVPDLKIGNVISFHFNQVCQVLNRAQLENLMKYTAINLQAFKGRT
ncbi:MAG: DUF6390 family protein [Patescibacteria group bacterium]|nr:DUF6390 family protein [Patescibacteria group bacterium]